jgi:dTDP-4-amino-4,6-dideoxy-D-galactose acyltransferase
MLEIKVDVSRVSDVRDLTERGFRVIDTNVQLTLPGAPAVSGSLLSCRHAVSTDEAAVRAIAAKSFTQTRFHLDPRIPQASANRVKEEWAGNFFAGRRGDWMIVAEDCGQVAGFLQALRTADDTLVVDLIAVRPESRGQGLGRSMIEFAGQSCFGGLGRTSVGTQISNIRSLRLYERMGFRISAAYYVLHMHRRDLRL